MKFKNTLLIFFTIGIFYSCNKKDDFNYPEGTVGSSKILYYPSVTINGEHLIIIKQGDTYTDPGVTSLLNGQPTPAPANTTVNTETPGIYNIVYEAKNPEGYSASDWRTVVVLDNEVAANDLSGNYLRAATGVLCTWTKTAAGIYTVENPGGAGVGAGLTVIAVNYSGNKIAIPKQVSADFGVVSSSTESYDPTSPATIKYVFIAGGYGPSVRTFVKQ